MMSEELGFGTSDRSEIRAATSTFVAFLVIGALPLLVFAYDLIATEVANPFAWSAIMTGIAFFTVGALKARFVDQTWWHAGFETFAVGGLAATLAYATGVLLQGVG
jgi:VIT1/CCC1 family predicted Fe2+/Mn2+ transporter